MQSIKKGASWAIEKVQETFLFKRGEGKINVLSKEETKRVLEEESCNFNRINLVHNLDICSTKYEVIHDVTGMSRAPFFP